MPHEFASELLAKLPPIKLETADFGSARQSNQMETELARLASLSMDAETEILHEIFITLGKAPVRFVRSTPPRKASQP